MLGYLEHTGGDDVMTIILLLIGLWQQKSGTGKWSASLEWIQWIHTYLHHGSGILQYMNFNSRNVYVKSLVHKEWPLQTPKGYMIQTIWWPE